jgi:hypothetical protein
LSEKTTARKINGHVAHPRTKLRLFHLKNK